MSETKQTPTCHKKPRVLTGVHVECEFPHALRYYWKDHTPENDAKALEEAVREFVEFLKDHRSQDIVSLDVVREYSDLCSQCNCKWETFIDEDGECCANCGTLIEKEVKS